jgi:outer membrane protein TolC
MMFGRAPALAGCALIGALLAAAPATAATAAIGVREVVERALAESHLVKAGALEVTKAGEGVRKAQALRYLPEVSVNLEGGLVPEARGTVVSSPDSSSSLESLGPFYRVELKFVQPLWTFGRLDATEALAQEGLAAQQARRVLTGANVGLDAARAYWGLAAAVKGESIARSMRRDFDKLLHEVEERLTDENSDINDGDLLEVRANGYGIDRVYLDTLETRRAAADAVRALLSLPGDEEPPLVDEPPPLVELDESRAAEVVARAVEAHPEVRALAAAARVQAAKVEVDQRARNPVLFIGGGFSYAHAGNRDEQDNPWVDDTYNHTRVGAEIGLKWDANLYRKNLDVSESRTAHQALLEQLAALRAKVGVDVRRSLRDSARARALLDSARAALKAAKSRLRLVADNWETGVGEVSEVIDAYDKYYRLRIEEPQREYELNIALARLGFVLGDVNLYLGWVHDGKVSL